MSELNAVDGGEDAAGGVEDRIDEVDAVAEALRSAERRLAAGAREGGSVGADAAVAAPDRRRRQRRPPEILLAEPLGDRLARSWHAPRVLRAS